MIIASDVILLCSHKPVSDPRINWIVDYCPNSTCFHVIGLDRSRLFTSIERNHHHFVTTLAPRKFDDSLLPQLALIASYFKECGVCDYITSFISELYSCSTHGSASILNKYFSASDLSSTSHFANLLVYLLDNFASFFAYSALYTSSRCIIACDLDTLLPAALISLVSRIPLIYDAHEFWPESNSSFTETDSIFLQTLENLLLSYTDYRITVSSGLSSHFYSTYGFCFDVVPNAIPLVSNFSASCIPRCNNDGSSRILKFGYIGNFAPHRGLEQLINLWSYMPPHAYLYLQGPDTGAYRDYLIKFATNKNLMNNTVFFLPSVCEASIVSSIASNFDIGIIPYEPIGINNKFCCPNKLSQYMAASTPVLANKISFFPDLIADYQVGWAADFYDSASLIQLVDHIVISSYEITSKGSNALSYHLSTYNWQIQSAPLYEYLDSVLSVNPVISDVAPFLFESKFYPPKSYRLIFKTKLYFLIRRISAFSVVSPFLAFVKFLFKF